MVHAYYEFQHVELSKVGSGKKKVLKPPGGASSNLFGGYDDSPSRPAGTARGQRGMASNISLGDSSSETNSNASSPPSTPRKPGSPNPPAMAEDAVDKKPVTVTAAMATVHQMPREQTPQQKRGRVPPGGHSTKLW